MAAADPATPPRIRARGLHKRFGRRLALRGVDLDVAPGEFVTVFGPNGAGKTTLVRCVATLARATEGSVEIDGAEVTTAPWTLRRRLGVVSHASFLYGALTARENLEFHAGMFDVGDAAARVEDVAARVGIADRLDDPVRTFSRGLAQRCAIARALVHDPDILLFDEPFAGLDPVAADDLRDLLAAGRGDGRTILLTSHDLGRGRELADRFVVLARGRIELEGSAHDTSVAELSERYRRLTRGGVQ